MYNEDFLQQQAVKRGWHKYYSLKKVGIGTHPTNGMIDFINYKSEKKIDNMPIYMLFCIMNAHYRKMNYIDIVWLMDNNGGYND